MSELKKETIKIEGMFCPHCEVTVSKALMGVAGVESASASFQKGEAVVTYDPSKASLQSMHAAIRAEGYEVNAGNSSVQTLSILIILISFYIIARHMGWTNVFNLFPTIETGMEMGMLFAVGLLTSIHCIAMCGGINLTQATAASMGSEKAAGKTGSSKTPSALRKTSSSGTSGALRPNLLYNLGRVISYTVTGAICGAIGQTISFSGKLRGILPMIVGVLMLLMAINMLGVFKGLRRFNIRLPKVFYRVALGNGRGNSSLAIGLLNGLMPCGPLQSMQIYALGTGSIWLGALSMFLFSLGTVPLMFGFGFVAGKFNQKYRKYMLSVSAVIIVIMGIHMIMDGMAVSGLYFAGRGNAENAQMAMLEGDVQRITTEIDYGTYQPFTVRAGVPLEWNIYVPEGKLNGCNGEILIPEYDLDVKLQEGDNLVTFTPVGGGSIPYSCWMGMIRSSITVVE